MLTFDNGYNSQFTQALPVLRRLGWVGVENIQLSGLPPSQGGLGEGQVRGLLTAGWELDTQGISHADLTALGSAALHYQVATARRILQQRYHVPVNWFCYPSGHYDATVIATVKAAGYEGSTTVVPGWAQPARRRLPAAPAAGARRHQRARAAERDREHSRQPTCAELLHGRLSCRRGRGPPDGCARRCAAACAWRRSASAQY